VACGGAMLVSLDATIAVPVFPALREAFTGASLGALSRVLTAKLNARREPYGGSVNAPVTHHAVITEGWIPVALAEPSPSARASTP
jgi:hypothetical protein